MVFISNQQGAGVLVWTRSNIAQYQRGLKSVDGQSTVFVVVNTIEGTPYIAPSESPIQVPGCLLKYNIKVPVDQIALVLTT